MGGISLEPEVNRETLARDHWQPKLGAPVGFPPWDLFADVRGSTVLRNGSANYSLRVRKRINQNVIHGRAVCGLVATLC